MIIVKEYKMFCCRREDRKAAGIRMKPLTEESGKPLTGHPGPQLTGIHDLTLFITIDFIFNEYF